MMTVMRISRYISLFLSLPVLLIGCAKEPQDAPVPEVTEIVPFTVTVQQHIGTRASFTGQEISSGNYVFSAGDKLYISGAEGNIYGALDIDPACAGAQTASFAGSLTITGGTQPTSETILSATLVGSQQGDFFTTSNDGRITSGPTYPSSPIAYSTVDELVQKYSHFTANFPYSVRSFTLTQQTVFMDFFIELYACDLAGNPQTVQMDIISSDGNTILRSVTGVPVGGNAAIAQIDFTTIFPVDAPLQGAQTWIINSGNNIQCLPNFTNDLTLLPNRYYNVNRSAVDDFTVEAPSSGNGAQVTFNYASNNHVQFRKYSNGEWSAWENYSASVVLSAGEKVAFRAQGTSYNNTSNKTLISTVNSVLIYGDLMSLVSDANYDRQLTLGDNAFKQAFKSATNINIHSDKVLIISAHTMGTSTCEGMFYSCTGLTRPPVLPATTIGANCYKEMFRNCSYLTVAPDLPATTIGDGCYMNMFRECSRLVSIPSVLPATQLAPDCYREMFRNCTSITSAEADMLPSVNLAARCYQQLFGGCSNLTTGPNLPATTLAEECYRAMFGLCAKLTMAPDLIAETLVSTCYREMFSGCTTLESIKCLARYNLNGTNLNSWVNNVKSSGTFTKYSGVSWPSGSSGIPNNWTVLEATQ